MDILPLMTVRKSVKESDKWQKAVLDAFEYIGREQFYENFKFSDFYRAEEGKMPYQELREAIPQLSHLAGMLDDADIPATIRNYPLLTPIIRDIVAKFIDSQDNFHLIDTGEIAEGEYLRYYNDKMMEIINEGIEREIKIKLAKRGFNPDENREFASPEEEQQYMQQLEAQRQQVTPEQKSLYDKPKFKTIGMQWGENVMERDRERFSLDGMTKNELRHKLLSGRWFRHYKVGLDYYKPEEWDPRNVFFSKEIGSRLPQDCNYVGRVHFMTPQEVHRKYHEHIPTDIMKELLGGNKNWKTELGYGNIATNISSDTLDDWSTPRWVGFEGQFAYNFYLNLQDQFGIPMGEATSVDPLTGDVTTHDRYLPRYHNQVSYSNYHQFAQILRDDFRHRRDLCQVTEVYFVAEDYWGILTYRTESGLLVTEDVTEDILPEFLRENKIKSTFKNKLYDAFEAGSREIKEEDENTIRWFSRPVVYEGVKISSPNLNQDLYLYCRPTKHQIKGNSDFEVKLPVVGWIGKPYAQKVAMWQSMYNLVMNQMYNMLEKEIGMFFLFDATFLLSEIQGNGDVMDAMVEMRNMIRDTGFFPLAGAMDAQKSPSQQNIFSVQNLSYAPQIQMRIQLATWLKQQAYETLGSNPQMALQPTKYETAQGVEVGQKASYSQVAEIFQEFNEGLKAAWEVHLSVAQYAESNKKEHNLTYTRSDGSMAFLRIADPNLPLRRLGLIPTQDSKKRAEIENYRQWLIQTNTLGTDPLDMAKFLFSDSSLEMIEIARQSIQRRQQQEEQKFQRESQLLEKEAQLKFQENEREHERRKERDKLNNEAKYRIETIEALGRVGDNTDIPGEATQDIIEAEKRALEDSKLQTQMDIKSMDAETKKYKVDKDLQVRMEEIKLKAQELALRQQAEENKRYIATINKN